MNPRIFLCATVVVTLCIVIGFVWVLYGTPIHDVRLLILERAFVDAHMRHPSGSILVEQKTYLGGQYAHGSKRCVYAIGELRSMKLSKDNIKKSYEHVFVSFGEEHLPVLILFRDESEESYELPFVVWQDELTGMMDGLSTTYMVYVATTYPYLGDPRCND
ncbi:hypothetical protein FJY93_04855 [Candidatus Kaiserbacteria bacterium]|nr:hypothetical protein [Candidatus Kaiserbacteria bacterium]